MQVVLGIDFIDGTPAREGEDLVAELHAILDESAAKGDVHDRAMRGVEFLYDFMKKKSNAELDSAEVAAEELATAMEDAAAAGEAAKEKNENAIKVLVLASKDVVELHVEVVTWIRDSVKVGFREWLREGTGADLGDYKQHFSVGKRDRLAQTVLLPSYHSGQGAQ